MLPHFSSCQTRSPVTPSTVQVPQRIQQGFQVKLSQHSLQWARAAKEFVPSPFNRISNHGEPPLHQSHATSSNWLWLHGNDHLASGKQLSWGQQTNFMQNWTAINSITYYLLSRCGWADGTDIEMMAFGLEVAWERLLPLNTQMLMMAYPQHLHDFLVRRP